MRAMRMPGRRAGLVLQEREGVDEQGGAHELGSALGKAWSEHVFGKLGATADGTLRRTLRRGERYAAKRVVCRRNSAAVLQSVLQRRAHASGCGFGSSRVFPALGDA